MFSTEHVVSDTASSVVTHRTAVEDIEQFWKRPYIFSRHLTVVCLLKRKSEETGYDARVIGESGGLQGYVELRVELFFYLQNIQSRK